MAAASAVVTVILVPVSPAGVPVLAAAATALIGLRAGSTAVIWVTITVLAVGTLLLKTVGPVLAGGWDPPPAAVRVIELLTPAMLTSLIITSTFPDGRELVLDARAGGLLAGALVLLARGPLVLALVVGAAVTAGLRLLG